MTTLKAKIALNFMFCYRCKLNFMSNFAHALSDTHTHTRVRTHDAKRSYAEQFFSSRSAFINMEMPANPRNLPTPPTLFPSMFTRQLNLNQDLLY
jgi:hypothetical protein